MELVFTWVDELNHQTYFEGVEGQDLGREDTGRGGEGESRTPLLQWQWVLLCGNYSLSSHP